MKNFFTSFKHFMSFGGNITKCKRPINNTCSEYSDGLKLMVTSKNPQKYRQIEAFSIIGQILTSK